MIEKSKKIILSLDFEIFERAVTLIIFFLLALVMLDSTWMLDRGFEITDEAYYILLAMHADTQNLYISAQHWMTSWLWQITGSLMTFRAAGMICLILTSMLLALGAFSICQKCCVISNRLQAKLLIVASSIISAMMYASTINFSPCYNLIASAGAYAGAGLVLFAVNQPRLSKKFILYMLAGCAVSAEVLSKASAGISTFVILIVWIWIFESERFQKNYGILAIVIGFFVFSGVALLANTSFDDALQALENGAKLFRMVQGEPISDRLVRYAVQFAQSMTTTLILFAFPLMLMLIYIKTRRTIFANLAVFALVATLLIGGYGIGGWVDGATFPPPYAIVAMLILALIATIPAWAKNRKLVVLSGGLIVLPYSVAMGTGNTLFTQVIVSLAPWGTLIGILLVANIKDNLIRVPVCLIGLCFFSTVSAQIITSGSKPYHMRSSLENQSDPFQIDGLGVIKVDSDTHRFLTDIQAASKRCDISAEMPFFGMYNVPGVALALPATPVLSPWLNNAAQADFAFENAHLKSHSPVVFALNKGSAGVGPEVPNNIRASFEDFIFCGAANYPYKSQSIEIWVARLI